MDEEGIMHGQERTFLISEIIVNKEIHVSYGWTSDFHGEKGMHYLISLR